MKFAVSVTVNLLQQKVTAKTAGLYYHRFASFTLRNIRLWNIRKIIFGTFFSYDYKRFLIFSYFKTQFLFKIEFKSKLFQSKSKQENKNDKFKF